MRVYALALVAVALLVAAPPPGFGNEVAVRLTPRTQTELNQIESIATSIWNCRYGVGSPIDVQLPAERLAELGLLGIDFEIVVNDVDAMFEAERAEIEAVSGLRNADWFGTFRDFDQILSFVDALADDHPDLVTVRTIGTSREGRPIVAFDLVAPGTPPDVPVVIFNAAQHAREWITPPTVLYIADQMADRFGADPRITDILSTVRIVFVPVVNPDGYALSWNGQRMWRKNTRDNGDGTFGVDPNRNWTDFWGGSGSSGLGSSEIYRGPAPFSEPETRALRDLALGEPTLAAHVDWHSFGNLLLHPHNGIPAYPAADDRAFFESVGDEMADTIFNATAADFTPQPGYQLYIASGTCADWFYLTADVPSWTFELRGSGFVTRSTDILQSGREMLPAALVFIERSAMPLRFEYPAGKPTEIEPDAPHRVPITVEDAAETLEPGSITVTIRTDANTIRPAALTHTAPNTVEFWLPPTPCGRSVEFTINARTVEGSDVQITSEARSITTLTYLDDDAETDQGWTYTDQTDTATDGHWERGDPDRTLLQPEDDTSPFGTLCFVTGAAEEGYDLNNDVDGGTVTLTSPALDLAGTEDLNPVLSYQRWVYSWSKDWATDEWFRVSVSDDDGATWTIIDEPSTKKGGWEFQQHHPLDFITPTDSVRVRFQANDGGADTPVEMAVDDVRLVAFTCEGCGRADLTTTGADDGSPDYGQPDGELTGADLQFFVNAWLALDLIDADLTTAGAAIGDADYGLPDGTISGADLLYYVNTWLAGCP